jgi:lipopolysaccharide transport system ATP-binding protein
MAAVEHLCRSAIVLQDGVVSFSGEVKAGIQAYLRQAVEASDGSLERAERSGDGRAKVMNLWFSDAEGERLDILQCGRDVRLNVAIDRNAPQLRNVTLAAGITSLAGDGIVHLSTENTGFMIDSLDENTVLSCTIPRLPLRAGTYTINLFLAAGGVVADWVRDAHRFQIEDADFYGTGRMPPEGYSTFVADHHWSIGGPNA